MWRAVEVTAVTGSTNADLLARAADGEPEGWCSPPSSRARGAAGLGRAWVAPPRAALTFSVLLRPEAVPRARLGWLPLLAGVAVAAAVRAVAGVDAQLKWPNDVLAGPGKLAGILAEAAGGGGGRHRRQRVHRAGRAAAARPRRPGRDLAGDSRARQPWTATVLLAEILAGLERRYRAWCSVFGDTERSGLRAEYTGLCATLGRRVRVELPGGRLLDGLAAGLDADGRLLVSVPPDTDLPVAAGDIVHLR